MPSCGNSETNAHISFFTGSGNKTKNHVSLYQYNRIEANGDHIEPELVSATSIESPVTALVALENNTVFVGTADGCISRRTLLIDQNSWTASVINRSKSGINALALQYDSDALIAGSEEGTTIVLNVETAVPVAIFREPDYASVTGVGYSSSAAQVVACSASGVLRLWDKRNAVLPAISMKADIGGVSMLHCLAINPIENHYMVTGDSHGHLMVWDSRQPQQPISISKVHTADVWDIRFHPNNSNNVFSCGEDGLAVHWKLPHGRAFSLDLDDGLVATSNLFGVGIGQAMNAIDCVSDIALCGIVTHFTSQ